MLRKSWAKLSLRRWYFTVGIVLYACNTMTPLPSNPGVAKPGSGLNEFNLGLQLELNNDHRAARDAYLRSLAAASSTGADPAFIADITYNLGRMAGYTCDFRTAEAMLHQSLKLVESRSISLTPSTSRRLFELGRLAMDENRFAEAVGFFERAMPVLENVKMASDDPLGFAYVLDELAYALDGAGQTSRAAAIRARSGAIRERNRHTTMQFRPKHFAEGCAENSMEKDWDMAHRYWSVMAAFTAKVETPAADSARVLFEYGRSLGVRCEFQEAERALRQAQQSLDRAHQPAHRVITELARLNIAQKRYLSALSYFDELFARVASDTTGDVAPGWHEDIVEEYANALKAVGRDQQANEKRALRRSPDSSQGREPSYHTPYGSQCANNDDGIMG